MRVALIVGCAALLACSLAARADGTGTSVTGSLQFNGNSTNYFNPANGFVPSGYGNSSGTTVTIGPGIEFGFHDGANTDTADFTGTTLAITDVDVSAASPFTMTFTDPAFTGFSQLTNNSGYSYSFSGDTLTVQYAGTGTPGTYTTTFSYSTTAPTPEPSSLALLGTSVLGMVGVLRRRFV